MIDISQQVGSIKHLLFKYFKKYVAKLGFDEAFQAGMIAAWKASLRYDPAKGGWLPLLKSWMRGELNSALWSLQLVPVPMNKWKQGMKFGVGFLEHDPKEQLDDTEIDSISSIRNDLRYLQIEVRKEKRRAWNRRYLRMRKLNR